MRVYEVLIESKQDQLDEGPIWDKTKELAKSAGKGIAKAGQAAVKAAPGVAAAAGKGIKAGGKFAGDVASGVGKFAAKGAVGAAQTVGDVAGSAVGGLGGGLVRGYKQARSGQAYGQEPSAKSATPSTSASSVSSAPAASSSSAAPTAASGAPKQSLVQVQQAVLALRPSDRAKLMTFLQSQQPAPKAAPKAAPTAAPSGVKIAATKPAKAAPKKAVAV